MHSFNDLESQQKDHLCGPFHVARMLRECGVTEVDGEPLDQDLVALRAGTSVPVNVGDRDVPPGATSWPEYRYELPRVDREFAGTSARGLVLAIEDLSGGRLQCVPVSGRWSAPAVEGLVAGVQDLDGRLLANVRTGLFWASRPHVDALLVALEGGDISDPPPADWDVGHFVEPVALMRGRRGALVLVRDTYPSLGFQGVHLQPAGALAAALERGDGRGGGVLAVVGPDSAGAVAKLATGLGLVTEIWDN